MDIRAISDHLFTVLFYSTLLAFCVGLFKFSKKPIYLKLLCVLTGVSFCCDYLSINYFYGNNNIGNLYRLFEFSTLLLIFFIIFGKRAWRGPFILTGALFILFFLFNLIYIQQVKANTYTNTLSAFVFLILSVAFFYHLMREMPAEKIHRLPQFWFNTGVLVYFAGTLFLFAIYDYLDAHLEQLTKNDKLFIYWDFHNFFSIVKNFLFTIALWPRNPTSK